MKNLTYNLEGGRNIMRTICSWCLMVPKLVHLAYLISYSCRSYQLEGLGKNTLIGAKGRNIQRRDDGEVEGEVEECSGPWGHEESDTT